MYVISPCPPHTHTRLQFPGDDSGRPKINGRRFPSFGQKFRAGIISLIRETSNGPLIHQRKRVRGRAASVRDGIDSDEIHEHRALNYRISHVVRRNQTGVRGKRKLSLRTVNLRVQTLPQSTRRRPDVNDICRTPRRYRALTPHYESKGQRIPRSNTYDPILTELGHQATNSRLLDIAN